MQPVTGPHVTETGNVGADNPMTNPTYDYRAGYKQAKPFNVDLRYERRTGHVYSYSHTPPLAPTGGRWAGAGDLWAAYVPNSQQLHNAAYDKFRSEVSERAQLGVTLAELNQSVAMIRLRAVQLVQFARAVVRRDFKAASRVVGYNPYTKQRPNPKKRVGEIWLEYWLGWSALIADLYAAEEVLTGDIPMGRVMRKHRSGPIIVEMATPLEGENPLAVAPLSMTWKSYDRVHALALVRLQANVRVVNPNLFLANQLGLTNPLSVLHELIPFSFVVEWFINFGQVISSLSAWYGLELTDQFTTQFVHGTRHYYQSSTSRYWDGFQYVPTTPVLKVTQAKFAHVRRVEGISGPSISLRPFVPFGWQRMMTAMSLLTLFSKGGFERIPHIPGGGR